MMGDFELLKDVPGYKAILKAVLRSQMQLLIEQLHNYTCEESFILITNTSDGAQSHCASEAGKHFLEGHHEIKSQFLRHCLSSIHKPGPGQVEQRPHNIHTKARTHPYSRGEILSLKYNSHVQYSNDDGSSPKHNNHMQCNKGDFQDLTQHTSSTSQLTDIKLEDVSESDSYGVYPVIDEVYPVIHGVYPVIHDTCDTIDIHNSHIKQQTLCLPLNTCTDKTNSLYDPDSAQSSSEFDHSQNENWGEVCHVKENVVGIEDVDDLEITGVELADKSRLIEGLHNQHAPSETDQQNSHALSEMDQQNFATMLLSDTTHSETNVSKSNPWDVADMGDTKHSFPCTFCGRVFQHNSWLTRHVRIHTGEKPFKCVICGRSFTRWGTLKIHMVTTHAEKYETEENFFK